jgi:predicted amidohydrolase
MTETTVAIVQQPPAVLDLAASLDRAVQHVGSAAAAGATLVVFPETWLTCYPAWVFGLAGWKDAEAQAWHARLLEQSVVLDHSGGQSDDLAPLREAARQHGVTIVIGIDERPSRASGSLYNSLVTIGADGSTLNLHRKVSPTHTEKIVWAAGDGAGLRVVETSAGRLGGLICWEHFNPLARQALHAQNEEIHVAAWPDMAESHLITARSYALEARCFVVSAGQILSTDDVPSALVDAYRTGALEQGAKVDDLRRDASAEGAALPRVPDQTLFDGGSNIVGPDGSWVVEPVFGEARLITATIDTDARYGELLDLDVAGHYARPDIFRLTVDRTRRDSGVTFEP